MGYTPIEVMLRRLQIPDSTNKSRLLFEVVTGREAWKTKYFLVLSPTVGGPHRLLIRVGNGLEHVLPLHDPERRYHLEMQPQLKHVTVQERQAIADLQQTIGYQFQFKVASQRIYELSVQSGDDADRIDSQLKHLKYLRCLEFRGSRLTAVGLTSLRDLTMLKQLRFSGAHIDDQGLSNMKDLPQLRELSFYGSQGITDKGLAHLTGLKNLKHLRIYREDTLKRPKPNEQLITDAGLKNLIGLRELEYLDLMGQRITDAGLECLMGLTKLKELYLSGDGITDAGIEHLKSLSSLQQVDLLYTRVTPAGKAALKSKLPMLNIGD